MLFQTPAGVGVNLPSAPKRSPIHLDKSGLRLGRARTFKLYQSLAMSVEQIAEMFNYSARTVAADLAWLEEETAAGRNSMPWDSPRPTDDEG